jgi:tetratricopeptide (TPR) repeat protein
VKNWCPLKKYFLIAGFFLFFTLVIQMSSGQTAWCLEQKQPPTFQQPGSKKNILTGIHLLYDRRFEEAEKIFEQVILESPERPIGYFYLAMVTWSRMASGFWSHETVEVYLKRVDHTVKVAKERIENGKGDSSDYFYLGGALGFKGRFELSQGNWLSAFFFAREAIDALKICHEMAPDNKDVLLGIGSFDYYTARLSGTLKFLSYLLLHKGNKQEGLRKLNIAASQATYSATEAKSMLLHIYLFLEENFSKSLTFAKDLVTRYDNNPRYKVLEGVSYLRLGMESEFRDVVDGIRKRGSRSPLTTRSAMWERRALYMESIHDLFQNRYAAARSKLAFLLKHADPKNDPYMVAWPMIKMGMSYDLEGNRKRATEYYRIVIDMKNGSGAQFLAKRLLKYPPKKQDPFIGY